MDSDNQTEQKYGPHDNLVGTTHRRNISLGAVSTFTVAIVSFFLAPFVLKQLGDTKYGIWTLINTVFGLSGLLDFGIRSAFDQRLSRAWHKGNAKYLAKIYATGRQLTRIMSVVVCGITLFFAFCVHLGYAGNLAHSSETITLIAVLGARTAGTFLLFPNDAVLGAARRFDIKLKLHILTTLLTAFATFACLIYTTDLSILALCCLGPTILRWLVVRILSKRIYSPPSHTRASSKLTHIFLKTGLMRFVAGSAQQVIRQIDTITVWIVCGINTVAPYALGATIASKLFSLQFFRLTVQGEMLRLAATLRMDELQSLLLKTTRLITLFLVPPTAISMLYASDFFSLWISDSPETLSLGPENIYRSLAIYTFCAMACGPLSQALSAMELHSQVAKLVVFEAIANLILSITFGFLFGSIGIAAATAVACLLIHIPGRILLARYYFSSFKAFDLRECFSRPITCVIIFLPLIYFAKPHFPTDTWLSLTIAGLCSFGLWLPIAYNYGLNESERIAVIKMVRKLATS